ncbi:ferredoxin [Williamsia phyllosphaerae]|uniref:Ferredoxin n=1 Tax=Williamsia phyllosphaerae TaxID=885042 RepID=A0ABQ1V475_9NOCA|nr:ferredoxin [Williamsia phyllosphaerae]GGF35827.1 ferredoxin [Williamsia phyllosphaerae]
MSIEIDRDTCVGAGQCVLAAPDVFDQTEDEGISFVRPDAPEGRDGEIADAVDRCPARAIALVDR